MDSSARNFRGSIDVAAIPSLENEVISNQYLINK